MRIAIAADHNGVGLKQHLIAWLDARGHEVEDAAPSVGAEQVDYPPLCEAVCRRVLDGRADFAVVVGGSGSGETIACNKLRGIRATLCLDPWVAEIARGTTPLADLVADPGVISVHAFSYTNVDPLTGNFGMEIRIGYESGPSGTRPVRGGSVTGNLFDALAEARFSAEPGEGYAQAGPLAVRFESLQIAGSG